MLVPNADAAEVPLAKIGTYLLKVTHPDAANKAEFLLARGFSPHRPRELISELRRHVQLNEVVNSRVTRYGTSYAVEGYFVLPDRSTVRLRSVWFIDTGSDTPRFVTAYPLGHATTGE